MSKLCTIGCCKPNNLIEAVNKTTQYTYYWCQKHRRVIKDMGRDGFIFGIKISRGRR